jgi:hypothetical protein
MDQVDEDYPIGLKMPRIAVRNWVTGLDDPYKGC